MQLGGPIAARAGARKKNTRSIGVGEITQGQEDPYGGRSANRIGIYKGPYPQTIWRATRSDLPGNRGSLVGASVRAAAAQACCARTPPPAAADWAALAKRPDFTGVSGRPAPVGAGRGGGGGVRARRALPTPQVPRVRLLLPLEAARTGGGAVGDAEGDKAEGRLLTSAPCLRRQGPGPSKPNQPATEDKPDPLIACPPGLRGHCAGAALIRSSTTPTPRPDGPIVIEARTQVRHIYIDSRPLPKVDPDPELLMAPRLAAGKVTLLVVESVGFAAGRPRAVTLPTSDKLQDRQAFFLQPIRIR